MDGLQTPQDRRSYRDSDAYRRSNKVRPDNGAPLWPLTFDLTAIPGNIDQVQA